MSRDRHDPKRKSDSGKDAEVIESLQGKYTSEELCRLPKIRPGSVYVNAPKYLKALKITVHVNALLSSVTILLAYSEDQWTAAQDHSQTILSDVLRITVLALCIIQLLLVLRYYSTRLQLQMLYGLIHPGTNVMRTTLGTWLVVEVVTTCMCTPPMLYSKFTAWHQGRREGYMTIGDVVIGFTCLRAYQLVYVLYWTERSRDRMFL